MNLLPTEIVNNLLKPAATIRDWQAKAQVQRLASRYPNSRVYVADTDGAAAMGLLWQSAADLIQAANRPAIAAKTLASSVVIGCNDELLGENFCEILKWGLTHVPDLQSISIQVEVLPNDKAVRLTRSETTTIDGDSSNENSYTEADINKHTQAWVKRVLVKMGICPFTKSAKTSGQGLADVGVPVGEIAYHTSQATNTIQLLADTWTAIQEFLDAGPEAQSSILLAAPFYDEDFATWAGPIFCILETTVVAAQVEDQIGVVCFHPLYATPDGSSWPGFGHMHSVPRLAKWVQQQEQLEQKKKASKGNTGATNTLSTEEITGTTSLSREDIAAGGAWQRRTPHATINVLRADQLARAEGRRDSATLYPRNIRALLAVGNEKLQADLNRERTLS